MDSLPTTRDVIIQSNYELITAFPILLTHAVLFYTYPYR